MCMPKGIYVYYVSARATESEGVLDPVELKLQILLCCQVGAGKQTQVLCKSNNGS